MAIQPNQPHFVPLSAMAQDSPDRYLVNMSKKLRTGKIFLDYLRNDRMSTAVAPLSPRIRPGAPVSMPLHWKQVRASLEPQRFTMKTALSLMSRNKPWQEYCDSEVPLKAAIQKFLTLKKGAVPSPPRQVIRKRT
jgi:bifunctional non-homologous end joining protein LigD